MCKYDQHIISAFFDDRHVSVYPRQERVFVAYSKNDASAVIGLNHGTWKYRHELNHRKLLSSISDRLKNCLVKCELRLNGKGHLGGFWFKNMNDLDRFRAWFKKCCPLFDKIVLTLWSRIKNWWQRNWRLTDLSKSRIESRARRARERLAQGDVSSSVMSLSAQDVRLSRKRNTGWYRAIDPGTNKPKEYLSKMGMSYYYDISACDLSIVLAVMGNPWGLDAVKVREIIRRSLDVEMDEAKKMILLAIQMPELGHFDPELVKLQYVVESYRKKFFIKLANGDVKLNRGQSSINAVMTSHQTIALCCLMETMADHGIKTNNLSLKNDAIQCDVQFSQSVIVEASERCFLQTGWKPLWHADTLIDLAQFRAGAGAGERVAQGDVSSSVMSLSAQDATYE